MQGVAFLPCPKLDDSLVAEIFDQPFQNFASQSLARHFAAAEEDGCLHLVAIFEEANHVIFFGLVVVIVDVDAELHFLDDDPCLFLLGLAVLLFLLVEKLAVIHNAADRRLRRRRNLNQVEPFLFCELERLEGWNDAELLAQIIDYTNFASPDALIGANEAFIDTILRCTEIARL